MQALQGITEESLEALRRELSARIGQERFTHTLGVEKMALKMGELLLPKKKTELSVAALLHDVTKEFPYDEQIALCKRYGIRLPVVEKRFEKTVHAKTGAHFAREHFPHLVTNEIFKAIARHTTGDDGMTVFDEIIFLADLIEEGRRYPISVRLRQEFFDNISKKKTISERKAVLHKTVLEAISNTIQYLITGRSYIAPETIFAYNFLKSKIEDS